MNDFVARELKKMARKGILQGSSQRSGSETQMSSGNPNIRRFREVFDDLRATAIQDIETDRIGASRFSSRIEILAGIEPLVSSIRDAGQQVPVLLRYAPDGSLHEFEPVYGQRRIAACRILGIPVRSWVQKMDDEAAAVAQFLENSARLDII